MMEDKLKEACGVFGIYSDHEDPAIGRTVYYGLYALQHRGQESAGIAVSSGKGISCHRGLGLVSEVFSEKILDSLSGYIAIGHVRYSTTGANTLNNAQPLVVKYGKGALAVAHNGNLVNATDIRRELEESGAVFQSTVDSEVIAFLIAGEASGDLIRAVKGCMDRIRGSYALAIMTEDSLIGVRDPHGLRPLGLGRYNGSYIISSESCAFDTIGAEFVRDIEPGEIVIINRDGLRSVRYEGPARRSLCIFEFVYFARPDSTIDGVNVHTARWEAGKNLAVEHPADADLVISVPDSGNVAAMGFAAASGIPFGFGLIKNRYIGRTFIQPSQRLRNLGVRLKLSALKDVIKGKRLVLVDDSIVRGTTSGQIVRMLKDAGAKEVHVRVSSPPIGFSCYFGIDTSSRRELIAASYTVDEIRKFIGADSLGYLSLEGLIKSTGLGADNLCTGCFSGDYPLQVPGEGKKYLFEKR
ncbi:amidophosphoribosyltransferase [Thermosediminibacter oceani DSM 16646]|uniref:Amidophosphoribosyltransferase n=2 Tax=Thermosediminibacter TaxID=291988 RepID=D9RY26_THEOJ|nr:amidophosphoribosyltransferase [Thermosediminibacter oceani]ADL08250.1 amidophosphoribosyltransferase [Thermosediminibacter oceani DSM 16646]